MKVDKVLVSKLEKLAQLELQPKEKEQLQLDLNKILSMVEKLNELDTTDVEPLRHITRTVNQLREDGVTNQISREAGLKNAPHHDGTYFKVVKVIPQTE